MVTRAFPSAHVLQYEDATFAGVLDALPGATVYHFACHGYANFVKPMSSGLLMADDNVLTVAHLVEERLSGKRLAVLSACETGMPSDLTRIDHVFRPARPAIPEDHDQIRRRRESVVEHGGISEHTSWFAISVPVCRASGHGHSG